MHLLSLCMIVRNEESLLPRCLESVKDLADEIVIVDTGSTDRTKEIARQYTDKIYDFAWTNNFAEARNESLRHATGKWILVLDADEYVSSETDKKELRRFLEQTEADNSVYMLPILNVLGDGDNLGYKETLSTRLFPNHRGIQYTGPIHEQLTAPFPLEYQKCQFYIYHTGYTQQNVSEKQKAERNWGIFHHSAEISPQDPFYSFSIGNEYRRDQDFKKALYHYEKAYKKGHPNQPWYPHCLEAMISIHLKLNRITDAYQLIQEGVRLYPNYPDFVCFQGLVLQHFGFHTQAIERFEACIRMADERSNRNQSVCLVSPDYGYAIPFDKLAEIYSLRMDQPKMVRYLVKQLQANPAKLEAAVRLAMLLFRSEPVQAVQDFFERNFSRGTPADSYNLFRIFLVAGNPQLAMLYFERLTALNAELTPLEICRLAIMAKNHPLYQQAITKLEDPAEAEHYQRIAGLLWENRTAEEVLEPLQGDDARISRLLSDLFDLQCYEQFDHVMAKISSPAVIETLAQHFFAKGEWDLAHDFYQHLEKFVTLKASSYEQLYYICLWKKDSQKALSHIQQAIRLEPEVPVRYGLLFELADQPVIKEYKQKFTGTFPPYRKLPFIANL